MLFCCLPGESVAQNRQVAITVDDLPGTSDDDHAYHYVMNRLTTYFSQHQIPAIGFVNEYKLYEDGKAVKDRVMLLEKWADHGLELGNHTYSHIYINNASLEEYRQDILKGEQISRPLLEDKNQKLRFFRHTQLRTGPTEDYRIALKTFIDSLGYTVAPVTIDHDEYIYAFCYANAEEGLKPKIVQDYLIYMEQIVAYYENLSRAFLGYELPQILLIHANKLNADCIDDLMNIFKTRDYQFIALEEALKDDAYKLPEGTYQRGPSWIHRWMIEAGRPFTSQPEVSEFIFQLYGQHR